MNHLQHKTTKYEDNSAQVGLKSNAKNCKVVKVNIKSKTSLNVGNRDIEGVDSSTYMGSNVTKDGGDTADIRKRIAMAGASFWMQDNILKITNISRKIKLSCSILPRT